MYLTLFSHVLHCLGNENNAVCVGGGVKPSRYVARGKALFSLAQWGVFIDLTLPVGVKSCSWDERLVGAFNSD